MKKNLIANWEGVQNLITLKLYLKGNREKRKKINNCRAKSTQKLKEKNPNLNKIELEYSRHF